ncbi:MAG: hypothetical protein HRT66_05090 [Flavobacteriaceae bacterium]|nr:hypothetical protein [Flavobacteriaceae bacterium]
MGRIWITAISLFLIITFLLWKISNSYYKEKVYGKKMWKQWGTKTFYWTGAISVSSVATILIMFLLKSINILIF